MRTKLFLSLALLSLLAAAQGRSQEREASLDAARKEGIVSWYSTLAVQLGRISPRSDLKPPYPRLGIPGLHLAPSMPSVVDDYNRFSDDYRKIFGIN